MTDSNKTIKQRIAFFLMRVFGWRLEIEQHPPQKAVLVGAHHTSNWDFFAMMALMYSTNMRYAWLGKDSAFLGPMGWIFRALGGIPVNRRAPQGYVQQLADAFAEADTLRLVIAPEGSRSRQDGWKTGFYYIARAADVPISTGFVDYARKVIGFGPLIHPSDDINQDLALINQFYATVTGKYPESQSEIRLQSGQDARDKGAASLLAPILPAQPDMALSAD